MCIKLKSNNENKIENILTITTTLLRMTTDKHIEQKVNFLFNYLSVGFQDQ